MKSDTICRDVPCDAGVAERPRYYARQLITPDDMTLEQEYFRSKLRTHNRMLHGWGVVCGALVCLVPKAGKSENGPEKNGNGQAQTGEEFEPWKVMVKPGYILGPYGDEINIDCTRVVDLRTNGVTGATGEQCVEASDPWCSEVFEQRQSDRLYIAVRYKEIATRPVRVQPAGCGCDDTRCENSRLRDGYEIAVLTHCPHAAEEPPAIADAIQGSIPECPPCPEEPWVGLAVVELGANGKVTKIDNCECRRLVLSAGHLWWRCEPDQAMANQIKIDRLSTKNFMRGERDQHLSIEGSNLDRIGKMSFGNDVEFKPKTVEASKVEGVVNVSETARLGQHHLVVIDKEETQKFEVRNAITIKAKLEPAPQPGPERPPGRRSRRKDEEA
jgi:hypothetical protein